MAHIDLSEYAIIVTAAEPDRAQTLPELDPDGRARVEGDVQVLRLRWAEDNSDWKTTDALGCALITLGTHLLREQRKPEALALYNEAHNVLDRGHYALSHRDEELRAATNDRQLALLAIIQHNFSVLAWDRVSGGSMQLIDYETRHDQIGLDRYENPLVYSTEAIHIPYRKERERTALINRDWRADL